MQESSKIWWPRYVGDYRAKTARLSALEHGVYVLLLDEYYSVGEPLPANAGDLQNICRCFAEHEQAAMHKVLHRFFILKEDGWHNERADQELQKRAKISEKRSNAAKIKHSNALQNACKTPANADANADANAYTATATATVKLASYKNEKGAGDKIGDKRDYSTDEIRSAKKGTDAYCPVTNPTEILPAGWCEYAESLNIPDDNIFASWSKFKGVSTFPYEFQKWKRWISKEKF